MLKDAKISKLRSGLRSNAARAKVKSWMIPVYLAKSLVLFLLFSVGLVESGPIDWPRCQNICSAKVFPAKYNCCIKNASNFKKLVLLCEGSFPHHSTCVLLLKSVRKKTCLS